MENILSTMMDYCDSILNLPDLQEWEYDKISELKDLCSFILVRKEIEHAA